jgi:Mg-chelatase subunit ChlD
MRLSGEHEAAFKAFLRTHKHPVPPHEVVFPTEEPTSCNIATKVIYINEDDEENGELEWSYRHECEHLRAYPRSVGEDFRNFHRARELVLNALGPDDAERFAAIYPKVANIAYDAIIDATIIREYEGVRREVAGYVERLKRAGLKVPIIDDVRISALEGRVPGWVKPDAPHETIFEVYRVLRPSVEAEPTGSGGAGAGLDPRQGDVELGPVALSALLPVAAELMEEGASVDDVVSSIIAYIEARGGKALPTNAPADAKRALVAWLHGGGAGTGQRPDVEPEVEDAVLDAYVERCFSLPLNVLPTRQGNVRVLPRERNGVWRLGDPIDELDVLETLRIYGTMVPGHTTIKAFERPVAQRAGRLREGSADIIVIVDRSSSMRERICGFPKWIAARNTALAVLGWARHIGASARLLTFADYVNFDTGWVEPKRVKEVAKNFVRRYYPFGNTYLSEALRRVDRKRATVYIIGDFDLSDWKYVAEELRKMAGLDALMVLLLVGREEHVERMAVMARECGVKVRAYAVDSPTAMLDNALRELPLY